MDENVLLQAQIYERQVAELFEHFSMADFHPDPARGVFPLRVNDQRIQKYLNRRRQLFSRWDQGVMVDEEMLFSVNPESAADECSRLLLAQLGDGGETAVCLDLFGGAGGFAISLARHFGHVFSVELEPERCQMIMHNARIYGVESRVSSILGDAFKQSGLLSMASVVTISPPWGGIHYQRAGFDLVAFSVGGNAFLNLLDAVHGAGNVKVCASILPHDFAGLGVIQERFGRMSWSQLPFHSPDGHPLFDVLLGVRERTCQ